MRILKISLGKIKKEEIRIIADFLKKGKVVALPTDTVYGFVADATNIKAINRLFRIKKRKKENPIPIFVRNLEIAKDLAVIDKNQEIFLKKVWPGKVTIVLERKQNSKIYGLEKNKIALRIPKSKLMNELSDFPLSGTSANISGRPPVVRIKELTEQFKEAKNKPDLIVDGGILKSRKPSRVIDLTVFPPKVLR